MAEMKIGKSATPTGTVFHLLGCKEDDLTRALAWSISRSGAFAALIVEGLDMPFSVGEIEEVRVQHAVHTRGRTDIELRSGSCLVIIEAKLGWNLPGSSQLERYESRVSDELESGRIEYGAVATLSECSREWASHKLPNRGSFPRRHLRWQQVVEAARAASSRVGLHERQLLRDLERFLMSTTANHDDPASQMTWIVPISHATPDGSSLNFIDTVKAGWYYNKVGKAPKGSFNFIGFRWNSALREIRLVNSRSLFSDPREAMPDLFDTSASWEDHELFELGPPIIPSDPVPYGRLFASGYHRALLDCLLTYPSVAEARDASRERFESAGLPF